jgi:hypothetical protein
VTTQLDKTLKRAVSIQGRDFVVSISPEGLKLTLKGRRKGFELRWVELVTGDAALTTALNASVGAFAPEPKRAVTPARRRKRLRKMTGRVKGKTAN